MLPIILSMENEEDRSFMEKLYEDYAAHMYRIAFDVLNNHHDAEDCVHETIERIIRSVNRFKKAADGKYLKKLIVIACRNVAINQYNKNQKYRERVSSTTILNEDEEWEVMDIPDEEYDLQKLVMNEQLCQKLHEIIDGLDLIYRDVIVLMQYGYSNEEIASLLGIRTELVRQRYLRAKKKIVEKGGAALYEFYRQG